MTPKPVSEEELTEWWDAIVAMDGPDFSSDHSSRECRLIAEVRRLRADEAVSRRIQNKAAALDDIHRRSDDAHALAQQVAESDPLAYGRNVWHIAVDEAVRARAEVTSLQSQLSEYRRDAERYRWLRSVVEVSSCDVIADAMREVELDDFDAVVDIEMSQSQRGEGS